MSNNSVSGSDVNSVNWKSFLGTVFKIKATCKVTKLHVFHFQEIILGILHAKELSSSSEWKSFYIIAINKSTKDVILGSTEFSDIHYHLTNTALTAVPSPHEGDRHAYLVKHVCKRYHADDPAYLTQYFGNGPSWRSTEH